jgi:putative inorganic carbon (HCO3(-)) transporter
MLGLSALFPSWLPIALGMLLVFWPIRRIVEGYWSIRSPVDWSIVALVTTVPVALWVSPILDESVIQGTRLLVGIVVYFAMLNGIKSEASYRWIGSGCAIFLLCLSLSAPFAVNWMGVLGGFFPQGVYALFPTLFQDTINPNVMAGSLVLLQSLVIGYLLFAWQAILKLERWLLISATLLSLITLLFTQSLGAWLALVASVLLLVALRWRRGWLVSACLLVGGFLLWLTGFSNEFLATIGRSSGVTLSGRIEVWSRALMMIEDFPFTGIGLGAFSQVADWLYPFFTFPEGSVPHAHNLILQLAVDLGIIGLIAWLAIFTGILWQSVCLFRNGKNTHHRWLTGVAAGLLGAQIALLVHGLSDAVVWGMVRSAPLVWVLWGQVAAGGKIFLSGNQDRRRL